MNTHIGSLVTPQGSVSTGATVIHPEAWRKGPGWLWDWGQREANEKSMLQWHINLSPNFITGIRCQEKSVVWRWLVGPYWLSWPPCALNWWRKWARVVSYRKIIRQWKPKDFFISYSCCWTHSEQHTDCHLGLALKKKPCNHLLAYLRTYLIYYRIMTLCTMSYNKTDKINSDKSNKTL